MRRERQKRVTRREGRGLRRAPRKLPAVNRELLQQLVALRDGRRVARGRLLDALGPRLGLRRARARAAAARAAARPTRAAGRAARAAGRAAEPAAAELAAEVGQRPRVRRSADGLRLADVGQVERERQVAALGAAELLPLRL